MSLYDILAAADADEYTQSIAILSNPTQLLCPAVLAGETLKVYVGSRSKTIIADATELSLGFRYLSSTCID